MPVTLPPFQSSYTIGRSGTLAKMHPDEYDLDPRGIVWTWEPPDPRGTYVMGIDPSVGITGWNRYSRVKEDLKTNPAAIEIVRLGRMGAPDSQVCEYAAPIDSTELAYVANVLGRLYRGTEEDQCLCIGEVTGPGSGTLRTLTEKGYLNLWMWQYYGDLVVTESRRVWWQANLSTLRDLWLKSSRHINLKKLLIRSPWLVEDLADARYDRDRMYAYNPSNEKGHGDRVRAIFLALWAANGWSMDVERTTEPVIENTKVIDPQKSDMTWAEISENWDNAQDSNYSTRW